MNSSQRSRVVALLLTVPAVLGGCGGGGGGSAAPSPPPAASPPPPPVTAAVRVSGASPFATNCAPALGQTLYPNSTVEPYLAVSPIDSKLLIGVWQQDRWSNDGAHGILTARSVDGGATWSLPTPPPLSHCMGGTPANSGDYDRVSDPWVAFSSDGSSIYQAALAFTTGTSSAVVVSVSTDLGQTWSAPVAVIRDAPDTTFNDKDAITADPVNPAYAYVVWDRTPGDQPAMIARTVDRGLTWQPVQVLFDPGSGNGTIGNVIVGLNGGAPLGTLVDCFTQFASFGVATLRVIRSTDQAQTWPAGGLATVASVNSVQTRDPLNGAPVRDGSILGSFAADPRPGSTTLYAAWEDATPVTGHAYNAILLSRSSDGGATWSGAFRVNADLTVPAFDPAVTVRGDGEIGLTYYDFRGSLSSGLPVSYWLARSSDGGATWIESMIDGPFDLSGAPIVQGQYFLGDYQALQWAGSDFLPFYAKTSAASTGPTDVFFNSLPIVHGQAARQAQAAHYAAVPVTFGPQSAQFRQAVQDNLQRSLTRRRQAAALWPPR
ncbi:MAG TPA: sialidase family protein [Burkholderiaceae bacterium]|nr:sialidase family protein [Burkholderiaceae bacterium]